MDSSPTRCFWLRSRGKSIDGDSPLARCGECLGIWYGLYARSCLGDPEPQTGRVGMAFCEPPFPLSLGPE
jgi:hypothetical protein